MERQIGKLILAQMMRFMLIFILGGIYFHPAVAQSYSVKCIRQKVDSTIRITIGDSIPVEYLVGIDMVRYQYQKGASKRIKNAKLKIYELNEITKGNFYGAELKYYIYFRDKHKVGWERFNLPIETIRVDADFNLLTPLPERRIPKYILNDDTTKFKDYLQATYLIKDQFPVDRNMPEVEQHYKERSMVQYLELFPEPKIRYESKLLFEKNTLRHHWRIQQIIRCESVCGYIESIEKEYTEKYGHLYETKDLERVFYLDALMGEIVSQGPFKTCCYLY